MEVDGITELVLTLLVLTLGVWLETVMKEVAGLVAMLLPFISGVWVETWYEEVVGWVLMLLLFVFGICTGTVGDEFTGVVIVVQLVVPAVGTWTEEDNVVAGFVTTLLGCVFEDKIDAECDGVTAYFVKVQPPEQSVMVSVIAVGTGNVLVPNVSVVASGQYVVKLVATTTSVVYSTPALLEP